MSQPLSDVHVVQNLKPVLQKRICALKFVQSGNPMNGVSGKARLRQKDGKTEVYLQLVSGESAILKTFTEVDVQAPECLLN